jgi:hypothetical protein
LKGIPLGLGHRHVAKALARLTDNGDQIVCLRRLADRLLVMLGDWHSDAGMLRAHWRVPSRADERCAEERSGE